MYAVKGRSWRAVESSSALEDGETLHEQIPAEALEPDQVAETKNQISQWLDRIVQERGYDNIVSCVSYVASNNDQFRNEAKAALAWRDAVYTAGYDLIANTPEGVTTPEQVLALLPKPEEFFWPET